MPQAVFQVNSSRSGLSPDIAMTIKRLNLPKQLLNMAAIDLFS